MSSVASKFRNFTRALSHSDLEDDEEDKSFIGKSYNFFSKLSNHNNHDASQPYQRSAQKKLKTLLVIDNNENEW